jgi:hypothetical protein
MLDISDMGDLDDANRVPLLWDSREEHSKVNDRECDRGKDMRPSPLGLF